MSFISYAQNFEDVMLWRALGHVQGGRYLDIGAQDPVDSSVSLAFYEHGWRGMHVEPNIHYAEKLRKARPDEAVLEVALGEESGIVEFFDIEGTGLSTLQPEIAERHRQAGFGAASRLVPMLTLDEVLARFRDESLHWLKIDVEGAEKLVLGGWRLSSVRPWVLVVESTLPLSQQESHSEWEPSILGKGYRFAYFDGLNRFYVAEERVELLEAFRYPPCVFDDFALVGTQGFCHTLTAKATELERQVQALDSRAQFLDSENERREAALVSHRQALDAAKRQLERESVLRAEQARLQAEVNAEHARLQTEANAERDRWRITAEDCESRFAALVQSRSWRITRPLRGLHRLLRGEYALVRRTLHALRGHAKRLLRPALLAVMRRVLARPAWRSWFVRQRHRWPRMHRRLFEVAQNADLIVTSDSMVALNMGQCARSASGGRDLNAAPLRVRKIYARLQQAQRSARRPN